MVVTLLLPYLKVSVTITTTATALISDENTFIGGLLLSGGTSLPMWWIGARCGASQLCEETARLLFFRPPSIVKRMLGYHDGGFNGGRLTRTGYLELDYNILLVKVMF